MPVDGGVVANINDDIVPGAYTWIDTDNAFGCGTNALFTLTVDAPTYTNYNTPSIVQTITCTYPAENAGLTLKRTSYYATGYTQWVLQATATPPAVYDLPLAVGVKKYSEDWKNCYSKAQDGLVLVHLAAETISGEPPARFATIATLPVGYRPAKNVAGLPIQGGTGVNGFINVRGDGVIEAAFCTGYQMFGFITFYAA